MACFGTPSLIGLLLFAGGLGGAGGFLHLLLLWPRPPQLLHALGFLFLSTGGSGLASPSPFSLILFLCDGLPGSFFIPGGLGLGWSVESHCFIPGIG